MADEDDEAERIEARKQRNRDRLEDDEMMTFTMFMVAAMAGGQAVNAAEKSAASAVNVLKARFT